VAQVHRVLSPRDEVIEVGCCWRKRCVTVKAPAPLDIEQDGAYDGQGRSLATESFQPKPLRPRARIRCCLTFFSTQRLTV
jgi:hypothetical protein